MDFQQVCTLSGLPPKTVEYYVEEKIITPFYPERRLTRFAEYAEEDVIRLKAAATLRRLNFPLNNIRSMLADPHKGASLTIEQMARLSEQKRITEARIEALGGLELGSFQDLDEMLETLAQMNVDLPLPDRDMDHDQDRDRRVASAEVRVKLREAQTALEASEASRKKYFAIMMVLLFLLLIAAGWILGPMIFRALAL